MSIIYMMAFLVWFIGLFSYLSALKQLDEYRKNHNSLIFGCSYSGLSAMGSDTLFLNSLWAGDDINEHESEALVELLKKARSRLRFQVFYSVLLFFLLMLLSQVG